MWDGITNSVCNNYKHACYLNTHCKTGIPSPCTLLSSHQVIAKADSGASRHYFTMDDKNALTAVRRAMNGPQVSLPNGIQVQATETGNIPLHSSLSTKATTSHVSPELTSVSPYIYRLCSNFE